MRKISANLVIPVSSVPLKNAIIKLGSDGRILELIDTGGNLREEKGLEFYPGIITPGFILPWVRLDEIIKPVDPDARPVSESMIMVDREFSLRGISGVGLVVPEFMASDVYFSVMSSSGIFYHPVIELCPSGKADEFETFNRGIDLVSKAWNEYGLSCSLTACSLSKGIGDLERYLIEYGSSHRNLLPPKGSDSKGKIPGTNDPLEKIRKLILAESGKKFTDIIREITLDPATMIFEEHDLGSLEAGKCPGLNLLTGYLEGAGSDPEGIRIKKLV
jgi:hypothetical protein